MEQAVSVLLLQSFSFQKQSQKGQPAHQSLVSHLSRLDREGVEWNSLGQCYHFSHAFQKVVSEGHPGHLQYLCTLISLDVTEKTWSGTACECVLPLQSLSFQKQSQKASRDTELCTLISLDVTEKPWSGIACECVTALVTQFSNAVSEGQPVHQSLYSHLSIPDREAVE